MSRTARLARRGGLLAAAIGTLGVTLAGPASAETVYVPVTVGPEAIQVTSYRDIDRNRDDYRYDRCRRYCRWEWRCYWHHGQRYCYRVWICRTYCGGPGGPGGPHR